MTGACQVGTLGEAGRSISILKMGFDEYYADKFTNDIRFDRRSTF